MAMDEEAAKRVLERYEALCDDARALGTPDHVLHRWRRIRDRALSGRFLTRLRNDHLAIVEHRQALQVAFEDVKSVVKGSPSVGSS